MDWSQHSSESVVPVAQRVTIKRIGSGFYIDGRVPELGAVVQTDRCTAEDLIARGKAEYAA